MFSETGFHLADHVRVIEPLGYLDMLVLEENARLIATDSGGVQREAYYLGIPCLTLRDESEWVATIQTGWNKLVGCDPKQILEAWFNFVPQNERGPIYGTGIASQQIADILRSWMTRPYERKQSFTNYLNGLERVISK
jgi:UDP-N-acetylglucosamine 2-epimerase